MPPESSRQIMQTTTVAPYAPGRPRGPKGHVNHTMA